METNKILNADFLDIIFEGKNKDYGAYELRKTYNRRLTAAIAAMVSVCLLLFLGSILANNGRKLNDQVFVKDIDLENYKDSKVEPVPPPPPPPAKPEVQKIEIARFTPPRIVIDADVKPDEALREIEDLTDVRIGTANVAGDKESDYVAPPINVSTGIITAPKMDTKDYDKVWTKVELEAKYPGGLDAWKKYLERNLNAQVASDEGAPVGKYTVKVQFIVDKEGDISNVQAIDVPKDCGGCGIEAVKVIKRGGKWEPAQQNGGKVIYQAIQNITFEVAADN